MNLFKPAWLSAILIGILASFATLADDHMLNGMNITKPFNVQANLCKLNPGVSEEDYDEMVDDYFDWAKKNSVEPVFVRQKPVFSHANANNPWPYDFVEFLAMDDYERWGKSWDMWLTSEDGAALNERWQSLAMCNVKQAHGLVLYADAEAMQSDDDRYVSWNWCTPKVGWEQLEQKHNDYVTDIKNYSAGMIGVGLDVSAYWGRRLSGENLPTWQSTPTSNPSWREEKWKQMVAGGACVSTTRHMRTAAVSSS